MNRNEKKKSKKKKTFVMFFYACGVSRVHQEFQLFEQILKKNVLILKENVVDSYFDDIS